MIKDPKECLIDGYVSGTMLLSSWYTYHHTVVESKMGTLPADQRMMDGSDVSKLQNSDLHDLIDFARKKNRGTCLFFSGKNTTSHSFDINLELDRRRFMIYD